MIQLPYQEIQDLILYLLAFCIIAIALFVSFYQYLSSNNSYIYGLLMDSINAFCK